MSVSWNGQRLQETRMQGNKYQPPTHDSTDDVQQLEDGDNVSGERHK